MGEEEIQKVGVDYFSHMLGGLNEADTLNLEITAKIA